MLNRLVASQWKKILGRLRRENRETKRANGILKTASVFRSESRLLHERMISYINTYKKQRGSRGHLPRP